MKKKVSLLCNLVCMYEIIFWNKTIFSHATEFATGDLSLSLSVSFMDSMPGTFSDTEPSPYETWIGIS